MTWRKVLLILVAACFGFAPESWAYVGSVSIWKDKATGKTVFVLSDAHQVGTPEENTEQMNYFVDHVLSKFVKQKLKLNVLYEDRYHYGVNSRAPKTNASNSNSTRHEEILSYECPIAGKTFPILHAEEPKDKLTQSTWTATDLLRKISSTPDLHDSVELRSIDPRFPLLLFENEELFPAGSFRAITQMGASVNEALKSLAKSDPMAVELKKYNKNLQADFDKIIELLGESTKNKKFRRKLLTKTNQSLINAGILTPEQLYRVYRMINDDTLLLGHAVEKEVLLQLRKQDQKYQAVIAGYAHGLNIESSLSALGFQKLYHQDSFTQVNHEFEAGKYEPKPILKTNGLFELPPHLKTQMEEAFLKISSSL